MPKLKWKDEPYDIGNKVVRLYSVEHLRHGNQFANYSKEQLFPVLEQHINEPHGAVALAYVRLKQPEDKDEDESILSKLIYHGNMYGIGASPHLSPVADMLWQAAVLIMEEREIEHPNELQQ